MYFNLHCCSFPPVPPPPPRRLISKVGYLAIFALSRTSYLPREECTFTLLIFISCSSHTCLRRDRVRMSLATLEKCELDCHVAFAVVEPRPRPPAPKASTSYASTTYSSHVPSSSSSIVLPAHHTHHPPLQPLGHCLTTPPNPSSSPSTSSIPGPTIIVSSFRIASVQCAIRSIELR